MNSIRVLLYKGFARYVRNRTAVALTFIVPIAMIYIFGQVFGLNRKESGPRGIPLAVVNESDHPAAKKDVRPMIRKRDLHFALVIPADVVPRSGLGLHLKILANPVNEIETQTVNGILQKAIFSNVPELLGQSLQETAKRVIGQEGIDTFNAAIASAIASAFGGDKEQIQERIAKGDYGFSRLKLATSGRTNSPAGDLFSRLVNIETEQLVGKDVKSPAATRVVGGWAIMFLMFALNGAATSLFEERKAGIFQRLLAAPVTRAEILWSRFLFGVVLGVVQLVTVFSAGSLLYGIDVIGHLGNLIIISMAAAAACTALGMFIASVSDTPESAMGLATFLVLTMSALGGAWFPVSFMPPFMQQFAKFTLTYWAMEGFNQVLWAGNTLIEILPTIGILLAITGGIMAIAIWRFNRGNLFE